MAQPPHPIFINLPPPGSNHDTPSEMPGTPTSTTTSLSALSTTAIKDGHRGHFSAGNLGRGHQHSPSTTSLEAERADRISRLAGLERVSTLRTAPPTAGQPGAASSLSPQTTPTSTSAFPLNYPPTQHLTAAYFDSNGQPVAVTKMSTVGSASATESHVGEEGDDLRTTAGDRDEDMLSTDTNYREAGSVASMGIDEDMDAMATRSVGGYEDRMSDDGSASLVGFGEGAGSTVSGPIYHRRVPPGSSATHQPINVERTSSSVIDARRDRDTPMVGGGDTPVSVSAMQERRDARMMDGVAAEAPHSSHAIGEDAFVDTTFRGPVVSPPAQNVDAAERMAQPLESDEQAAGPRAVANPGRGKFYMEGEKKHD
ncbi:hypothetical protein RJ55_08339 [Drechmeria coniospora]|nr:hypothetical protein RJ55_08339 [Drechmeria coniospora]